MNTRKEEQALTEWLLDDLLTTILDSSPEELVGLHNKLEASAESIQERKSELAPSESEEETPEQNLADIRAEDKPIDREEVLRLTKKLQDSGYGEPTPPSQIEESQAQKSLREMYELGKEHGRNLALKDMEIERLIKETEELL